MTAKVTVRRDEFRTYITEYIVGSANVDGGGLFAQIAVEKDQTKNKLSILVDSLFPIFDGGVETFSVSPPARAFAGWIQFKVRRELNKDYLASLSQIFEKWSLLIRNLQRVVLFS